MKKLIIALILSIIIHMLFLLNFKTNTKDKQDIKEQKKVENKTQVKYVKLTPPKPTPKPQEQPKKKPLPKPPPKKIEKKELKEVKKVTPQPKREPVKEPKKIEPKPKEVVEVTPKPSKPIAKPIEKTALQKEQQRLQEDNLSSFLQGENYIPVKPNRNMLDAITKSYLDLYGEEYNELNETQKIYLHRHLKDIGRITEYYLRYPELAARLRQDGTNVIEFFLHPNGDISELKLISSSGSKSLDENSVDTIWIAYKDYPRPEEITKIKIYINYYLY